MFSSRWRMPCSKSPRRSSCAETARSSPLFHAFDSSWPAMPRPFGARLSLAVKPRTLPITRTSLLFLLGWGLGPGLLLILRVLHADVVVHPHPGVPRVVGVGGNHAGAVRVKDGVGLTVDAGLVRRVMHGRERLREPRMLLVGHRIGAA